jgi:O-antigen ligase
MDQTNLVYTSAMIGWGAVIGSAISFLLSGAILWAIFRLYQRKIALPAQREVIWIGAAFALFFLSEALAGTLSYSGYKTFQEVAERLPFLGFLFVYGRLSLSRREDVLRSVEVGVVTGGFATLAYALFQAVVQGQPRAEGMAGNPGPFALVTAVLFGLAVITAMRRQDRMRLAAVLAAIATAVALILSGMRSLWPMLVIAPVIPLAIFRSRIPPSGSARAALFATAAVVIAGFFTMDTLQMRVAKLADDYERIVEHNDYDNSLGQRLRLWHVGLERAAERPIFGHGPGNAMEMPVGRRDTEAVQRLGYTHFHNFLLNAMVRSGLIGVTAILLMLVLPIWICARKPRDETGDFGFAMLLSIELAYVLSGVFGIMLGHDISDALFIYGIIVSSFLVLGKFTGAPA